MLEKPYYKKFKHKSSDKKYLFPVRTTYILKVEDIFLKEKFI